jgi:hypothetical protein
MYFLLARRLFNALVAEVRRALIVYDSGGGLLLNLYKIAHYDSTVYKGDNFAGALSN